MSDGGEQPRQSEENSAIIAFRLTSNATLMAIPQLSICPLRSNCADLTDHEQPDGNGIHLLAPVKISAPHEPALADSQPVLTA